MTIHISDSQIKNAIDLTSSMEEAAAYLGVHIHTFRMKATIAGLYKPATGKRRKFLLSEILEGKHPTIQSYKLKLRLYNEGIKKNQCEICNISEWNGQKLECELDHIDGDSTNHRLNNLRIICPNCHSQTSTFRFKKR